MRKYLLILALAGMISCQDDISFSQQSTTPNQLVSSHTISVAQAKKNLKDFLKADIDTRTKKSIDNIENIITISPDHIGTRAANLPEDCNAIMYAVNFSDEQGYAILSADDRIDDEVIAITSEGSITQSDIEAAKADLQNTERPIYDGYPKTGEGLISVEEYPDELFLNPNTFSPLDSTVNDYWIGDFSFGNEGEEDENGNLIEMYPETRSIDQQSASEHNRKTMNLCLKYALNELEREDMIGSGGNNSSNSTKTTVEKSHWVSDVYSTPLLFSFSMWNQHSPFNDLYLKKRKYLLFGHKRRVPAGCFPLALAKILTHFQTPSYFSYNGNCVDWNSLTNIYNDAGKRSAAVLLRGIAEWCDSWYFYQGTFTIPSHASSFLSKMGYANVKRYNYKYDRITSMIDKGCPVIIYAIPGLSITSSHAWIIDGYKIKKRNIITTKSQNGNVVDTKVEKETCKMVHCDFGWGGDCNGYYVDGIFKLNNSENEFDSNWHTQKKNYNHHVRIIMYDKP